VSQIQLSEKERKENKKQTKRKRKEKSSGGTWNKEIRIE
jgi:hypothetical protein